MNDVLTKIKKYKYIIIGGIIIVVLYVCSLWSDRKDLYDNGKSTDAIRNELDRAEGAKQNIAGTASDVEGTSTKLENAIKTATNTSTDFDKLIDECTNIIDAVRKQPAN